MPIPRPANSVTSVTVVNPGDEDQTGGFGIRYHLSAETSPCWTAFARILGRSSPAPSSVKLTDTSLPACCRSMVIVPTGSFPALERIERLFDAMDDTIAQQVLEGPRHAIEHATVHFNRAAD